MKLLVCNWKMNYDQTLAEALCSELGKRDNVLIAIPTPFVSQYSRRLNICAQHCSQVDGYGAMTGEVSAKMLVDCGVNSVIIGHSERRTRIGESITTTVDATINALNNGMNVFFCVDDEYDLQLESDVRLQEYIRRHSSSLSYSSPNSGPSLTIAYEPVSAIGTGLLPTTDEINGVCGKISEKYGLKAIYGGSVNSSNAGEILALENVSGILVGGASLKLDQVLTMAEIAREK